METIGKRIKELRKEQSLTQIDFANALHIDKSTIAKYETDKATPSVQMLVAIAKFFNVSTDYLLGLED